MYAGDYIPYFNSSRNPYLAPPVWKEELADEGEAEIRLRCAGNWPIPVKGLARLAAAGGKFLHLLDQAPLAGMFVDDDLIVLRRANRIETYGDALHEIAESFICPPLCESYRNDGYSNLAHEIALILEERYKRWLVFYFAHTEAEAEHRANLRKLRIAATTALTSERDEYADPDFGLEFNLVPGVAPRRRRIRKRSLK